MSRVEDYMQKEFNTIADTAPVMEALKRMGENQFTYLVVLRGVQIAGIITRTDLINSRSSILLKEGEMREMVSDQTLIAIRAEDYMHDARSKFERSPHIDQIVVLELLTPVGILTKDDMLRWIYEEEYPTPIRG